MRFAGTVVLGTLLLCSNALPQTAPAFDVSGDYLLTGDYFFRHVAYISLNTGTFEQLALYGTISFDGAGNYTINGTKVDTTANNGAAETFSVSGTYGISASGLGSMTNPVSNGDAIFGLVSQGIFMGSSTESNFNDLFVAIPASTVSGEIFSGSYWTVAMDVPSADITQVRDAWLQLNPDGAGNLGATTATGYIAATGTTQVTQSIAPTTYTFTGGIGTIAFPASSLNNSILVQGSKLLFISADGNFIMGGSPTGFDFYFGVRNDPNVTDALYTGLYYSAGLDEDTTAITSTATGLDSYYGSFVANQGTLLAHQRINSLSFAQAFDYSYDNTYPVVTNGSTSDSAQTYWIGAGGTIRVGVGPNPYMGISLGTQAPSFSGNGVFINPTGVVNAASSAPFTAGIAGGEFVSLYGTGLAPELMIENELPFPTSLDNVQVLVDGVAAPIYFVSPNQISFIVPQAASSSPVVSFQVINNGVASNIVTSYASVTAPGAFTIPAGGIGTAAALHTDYSIVSDTDPAVVGETLQVFVSGLGPVNPTVADGAAAPGDILSYTTNNISVYIDGQPATVSFAGLAPFLVGVYQLNVTVPSGIHSGAVYFDISGPDSYTSEGTLPIASGSGTISSGLQPKVKQHHARPRIGRSGELSLPGMRRPSARSRV